MARVAAEVVRQKKQVRIQVRSTILQLLISTQGVVGVVLTAITYACYRREASKQEAIRAMYDGRPEDIPVEYR